MASKDRRSYWKIAKNKDVLSGNTNTLPVLARPFYDTTVKANNVRLLNLPGSFSGSIETKSEARLWGAEIDAFKRIQLRDSLSLDAITGFRFLNLEEANTISDSVTVLQNGITAFNGVGQLAQSQTFVTDRFATQNRFYGVPLGLRVNYETGAIRFSLTGKVSLGVTHEVVALSGSSTLAAGPNPLPATVPGGLYVLAPNLGRYTKDTFAAAPEVNFRVGYKLTSHLTLQAGYNFMYISRVVRPGEQINETVNPTFIPTGPNLGVPFGPRQPAFTLNQSDFWAHGANVAAVFSY